VRRSPNKYLNNPTKAYQQSINSKLYTLYELPGYQNELISKNKYSQLMQTSRN